jgi:hypothetical protein
MPKPSKKNDASKSIAAVAIPIAIEVGAEIAKLVIAAIANDDPATLKKVQDILPKNSKLRAELVYAAEMEKLRKKFESTE